MPAISVGSVEVDVVPNTRGIYARLREGLVDPADRVGDEVGRIIGRHVMSNVAQGFQDGVQLGGRRAQAPATRQGSQTGSAFARGFKGRLQAALADLPEVRLHANSSEADREIAAIRAQLQSLQNVRVGIDVSEADAVAAMDRIRERLARLSASDANVQVRVDAGAAAAQLAAFQAEVDRLDGRNVDVDVDTGAAVGSFNALTTAAIAFGPAILPVLPVVAAGLGAVAAAGIAAGAGLGGIALVAVPAFRQIGGVLQAQKAAQDAATQSTTAGGQAADQAASKARQLASAQQAVAAAERNGARQVAQAQVQVSQARQAASQVAVQAQQRSQQAARAVQDAERSLADAQRAATAVQKDLTAARAQAAQELQDLSDRLTDAQLSQRDAEIALKEATAERDKVLKNAKSTELDKQKALLAYDQAVQRLNEQTTATKRLKAETAQANKAGVNGSKTVKDAQAQVAAAQRQVADRTRAVKDAQADQARVAQQNAQQIAAAQQRIADAQARVGEAQQQAADQAASAQRQLEAAQSSTVKTADAGSTAQAKYRQELAKLTPEARAAMNAYTGLKSAFSGWSRSLQPAVLPIFTRALVGLRSVLPGLTPFVTGAADAVSDLQDRFGREVKTPFWRGFKKDLQTSVKPSIVGLGVTFGNVIAGMTGVVDAFLPHVGGITGAFQRSTAKFAEWGKNLKGSPGFERFLAYAAEKAPLIGRALADVAAAFLGIGVALSPLSGPLLQVIDGIARGVVSITTYLPELVLGMYAAFVATKLWAAGQILVNGAMVAFNVISKAGPWGWIILGITAVVLAVTYMYRRFGWFRAAVQVVWSAIKAGAMWLWENGLKPVFNNIWAGLKTVGRWAVWLWENALRPAFRFISVAARILATVVVVAVILPMVAAFKLLGAVGGWLWKNALRPAFGWIATGAKWLYNNGIKPQIDLTMAIFRAAGKAGMWLWDHALKPAFNSIASGAKSLWRNGIKPAWDGIVSAGKWAYEHGIKPVFDSWKQTLKGLGSAFSSAVDAIESAWSKVKAVTRKPVQYVVDVVYNNGIRGVWNKVADAFGAPNLPRFKFAAGGVLPGYTPGRDVHKYWSPTGGGLELSGGEAIMRPEFTRAVGSGFVGVMNSIAKSRGAQGVKAALAPMLGGNPIAPTDRTLRYKDGGIFGWIGSAASKVAGAGSTVWNSVKKGATWLADTLEGSARAGVKNVVNPLLNNFPGMDTGFGQMIRRIPTHIIDALFGYSKKADGKNGGAIGGPRIKAALSWAKSQAGKPYIWGGVGPKGFDCSGFMGAIENVIRGLKPNSRRWATGAFAGRTAAPGWVYHGNSPFRVGITNAGVGHTAGTLGGTNVESRGGSGVLVGSRARGYKDSLFTDWYGFQPGKYDTGGWMPKGMNLMYNGLGQPEAVLTPSQWSAIHGAATRGSDGATGGPSRFEGNLYLDSGEFLGKVRGEAEAVVTDSQKRLIQVLNAS